MKEAYKRICEKWNELAAFQTTEDIDHILSDFKILFAYHSGKIENEEITYDTTLEIFEGKKILNFSGDYRTLYETVNQKDCYQFLLQAILKREPFSIELIKQVHYELAKHTYDDVHVQKGEQAGEFKKGFYVVGEYQVGVEPEKVEDYLRDLFHEVNDYSGNDPLRAASYFHVVFERIHPFADANGRVGRTMMNYYLMTHDHPPIVIREYNRKQYVNAFDRFHYDAELEPMIDYLKNETVETWKHLIPELTIEPKRKSLADLEREAQAAKKPQREAVCPKKEDKERDR